MKDHNEMVLWKMKKQKNVVAAIIYEEEDMKLVRCSVFEKEIK